MAITRQPPRSWKARVAAQFDWPQGLGGRLAGAVMARMNAPANRWAIDLLEVRPGDRVPEPVNLGETRQSGNC
jgi:hypothetical protein